MNTIPTTQMDALNDTRLHKPWQVAGASLARESSTIWLARLANTFSPITLNQMEKVSLLDRTDTKYIVTVSQLRHVLSGLQDDFLILSVNGQRLNRYRTIYFDTPSFDFYYLHVNDRADRYKVRSREYLDSNQSFLEVKHKNRKDRTIKDRVSTQHQLTEITSGTEDWLSEVIPHDCQNLEPKLLNTFTRITLVNRSSCERVTIDVDITFSSLAKVVHLNGLAVVEVKLENQHQTSTFLKKMHLLKIHPWGFSKYCIGVSLLYSQVKKNALKAKLLWLNKITEGSVDYE